MFATTLSASRAVLSGGKTGAVVERSGPYRCDTHRDIVLLFQKGSKFSNCPVGQSTTKAAEGHATTWSIVKSS